MIVQIYKLFTVAALMLAVVAQTEITVPDLTGLTSAKAAQQIGQAGLLVGQIDERPWTASSTPKPGQIVDQNPRPGTKVAAGTVVDVTVLRAFNLVLKYDNQQITLTNATGKPITLNGIAFESSAGSRKAAEWTGFALQPGRCFFLARASTAPRPACVQVWMISTSRLFWQATEPFLVTRNGNILKSCPPTTGECSVAVPQGDDPDTTAYLQFRYRESYLAVRNETEQWMALRGVILVGRNGKRLKLDAMDNLTAGDVPWPGQRLAPGQCVVFSDREPGQLPPYDCDVVGYIRLAADANAWLSGFDVLNTTNNQRTNCKPPDLTAISLCVVPRE